MSEDEKALVTDEPVISPCCLKSDQIEEVHILKGHEKGEWWYSLHGRRTDCFARGGDRVGHDSIDEYHRYMSGHVRSVSLSHRSLFTLGQLTKGGWMG